MKDVHQNQEDIIIEDIDLGNDQQVNPFTPYSKNLAGRRDNTNISFGEAAE